MQVGIIGWRGMVGSVLVQRMREEHDFDLVDPVFFSTSQAGAAALDIALGVAIYLVRRRRWLWRMQIALILGYSAIIAVWLPELWLHPFGPLLKNLPMLAAILVLHELEDPR